MTETIFGKCIWCVLSLFRFPSANMEGAGFTTYTAASHQGVIEVFWLHFWEAVKPSILVTKWLLRSILFSIMCHVTLNLINLEIKFASDVQSHVSLNTWYLSIKRIYTFFHDFCWGVVSYREMFGEQRAVIDQFTCEWGAFDLMHQRSHSEHKASTVHPIRFN